MQGKRRLAIAAGLVSLVSVLDFGLASAAQAAPRTVSTFAVSAATGGGSFDLYADNGAVELFGTVTFNSNGSATIRADGSDNKADGYGPYLKIEWFTPTQNYTFKSCSIGAGGVCPLPTFTTPGAPRVTKIQVTAADGSGGNPHVYGGAKMFTR